MPQILLIIAAFLVAALVMGLTGFGFGLIAMGVLPFVMDVPEATALVALAALPVTLIAMIPLRRSIDRSRILLVLAGGVVGVPLGIVYLVRLDESLVRVTLGAIILLAVGASLYSSIRSAAAGSSPTEASERVPFPGGFWRSLGVALLGVAGGALGGAFSVSGPPVVLYFNEALKEKRAIKASLLAFFSVVIAVRVPIYASSGILTGSLLLTALAVLPAIGVGLYLGTRLHDRLPTQAVRRALQVLLAITATLLLVGA